MSRNRPPDVYRTVVDLAGAEVRFALATVLAAEGATPAKPGAKAVFCDGGQIVGTIGGGAVEAQAARRADAAMRTGRPAVFDFLMAGEDAAASAPVCGGKMRVLVDPTAAAGCQTYAVAVAIAAGRGRGVLLSRVSGPAAAAPSVAVELVAEAAIDRWQGFPAPAVLRSAIDEERPFLAGSPEAAGQSHEVFVDPLVPPPLLVIVGGGHVGQALAWQADLAGFEVAVIDDRPEFAAAGRFPAATATRCGPMDEELRRFPLNADTYVVIVTRGHQYDAAALAACIRAPLAYAGMIGSRRKVEIMRRDFVAGGKATAEEFDRVYAPIGLDVGAVTVAEIAASIVAQLIAVRRRGTAERMPSGASP